MGMTTEVIKYNIADREREHRGIERNFDGAAFARLANSPEIQEQVMNGDMTGFYGHWPRVKFGMNPAEGGIVDGKHVSVEPALRCVYLKGHENGDVEYKIEFLDTPSGKLAERCHKAKHGGFSSAIDFKKMGSKSVPYAFYGFDYVFEPNFSGNRGYALDSVDGCIQAFDDVSNYNGMIDLMNDTFDEYEHEQARILRVNQELRSSLDSALETIQQLTEENLEYQSMAIKAGGQKIEDGSALDGVKDLIRVTEHSRFDEADSFLDAPLESFREEEKAKPAVKPVAKTGSALDKVLNRFIS